MNIWGKQKFVHF